MNYDDCDDRIHDKFLGKVYLITLIMIIAFTITRLIYRINSFEDYNLIIFQLVIIFISCLLMVILLNKFSVKTITKKILTIKLGYRYC